MQSFVKLLTRHFITIAKRYTWEGKNVNRCPVFRWYREPRETLQADRTWFSNSTQFFGGNSFLSHKRSAVVKRFVAWSTYISIVYVSTFSYFIFFNNFYFYLRFLFALNSDMCFFANSSFRVNYIFFFYIYSICVSLFNFWVIATAVKKNKIMLIWYCNRLHTLILH